MRLAAKWMLDKGYRSEMIMITVMWKLSRTCTTPHSLHFPSFLVGQGVQVSNGNDKCSVEVVAYVYYPHSLHFLSFLVGQGVQVSNTEMVMINVMWRLSRTCTTPLRFTFLPSLLDKGYRSEMIIMLYGSCHVHVLPHILHFASATPICLGDEV